MPRFLAFAFLTFLAGCRDKGARGGCQEGTHWEGGVCVYDDSGVPAAETGCDDGDDDDGDGLTDCDDDDCASVCLEDCDDGVDNDADGLADCDDGECAFACAEDCDDGIDNDGDGRTDCDDYECASVCVENCRDGADNDGDGLTDSDDPQCASACGEDCTDGVDDDGDGLVDCEGGDCADHGTCTEACEGGMDDDGDGLTDCDDDDCWDYCLTVSVRVTGGGGLRLERAVERTRWERTFVEGATTVTAWADSISFVSGAAGFLRPTATVSETCRWAAGGVQFGSTMRAESSYAGAWVRTSSWGGVPATRATTSTTGGCAARPSFFLPRVFRMASLRTTYASFDAGRSGVAVAPGWYRAGLAGSALLSSGSSMRSGSVRRTTVEWEVRSWNGTLLPASPFTFTALYSP